MDKEVKVSTVTSSSDLTLSGQRSKFKTISNNKNNSLNVLGMYVDEKVSTLTSSRDLPFRGKGQKVQNIKLLQLIKLILSVL